MNLDSAVVFVRPGASIFPAPAWTTLSASLTHALGSWRRTWAFFTTLPYALLVDFQFRMNTGHLLVTCNRSF